MKAGGQVSAGCAYFMRFSNVEALKEVRNIRCIPYSSVRIKLLGRSSQGTTWPSFSD